jgi:hypothetical protein
MRPYYTIAILFILGWTSCKGPKGDPGPVGPQGGKNDTIIVIENSMIKEGYVKGTITGKGPNGIAFTYPFDFRGLIPTNFSTYGVAGLGAYKDSTSINISRNYAGDGESFLSGLFHIQLTTPSIKNLTVTTAHFDVGFEKMDSTQTALSYSASGQTSYSSHTITQLRYDSTTHYLTGHLDGTFTPGNSGFSGHVIADFDVPVFHIKTY